MTIVAGLAVLLSGCSGDASTEGGGVPGNEGKAVSEAVEEAAPDSIASSLVSDNVDSASVAAAPGDALEDDVPLQTEESSAEADDNHIEEREAVLPEAVTDDNEAETVGRGASHLRVVRAYVCKGIEQSEPTEAGKSFVPEDGVLRLCCFSEIAGATGPDVIYHVWRWGDREMARVELEVKSPRWRTWSTKRILDEWRGEWHVDITDRDGVVLTTLDFSVE
jgi:hypothetical protein